MRYSTDVKSMSYLDANTAAVPQEPMIMTRKVEAPAVIPDVDPNERAQEKLALLEILALDSREIDEGKVTAVADVVERVRASHRSGV